MASYLSAAFLFLPFGVGLVGISVIGWRLGFRTGWLIACAIAALPTLLFLSSFALDAVAEALRNDLIAAIVFISVPLGLPILVIVLALLRWPVLLR